MRDWSKCTKVERLGGGRERGGRAGGCGVIQLFK